MAMSEALQALYQGDVARARELLPTDARLTIFEAAAFGRIDRLREILAADPSRTTALSDDGFTPLHLAVFGGQEEAAQVLIDHGADVDRLSNGPIAQVPPLGTAAFVRSLPLARLLLDAGADVDRRGGLGFTALHAAAGNGDLDLARELVARGADPQIRTEDGRTAADLASTDALHELLAP
jgi:ankyrin repeat protein